MSSNIHVRIHIFNKCIPNKIIVHDEVERRRRIRKEKKSLLITLMANECVSFMYHNNVPRQLYWVQGVVPTYDPTRFLAHFGMEKSTFGVLLGMIEGSDLFKGSNQFQPDLQLAITLYRLRAYGAKTKALAAHFGIGDGASVGRITDRVFLAILANHSQFVYWPTRDEKTELLRDASIRMPHCIAIVDGSSTRLWTKPCLNPHAYYSYKQQFCLRWQVTCDLNKKVRHLVAGQYGSTHDATMYENCSLYANPTAFFDENEYLMGDSAYPLTRTCVTPYKANSRHATLEERVQFNKVATKHRVIVENCIGEIKNQFPTLRGLHIQIRTNNDLVLCSRWISVCVILHNFIMDYDDYTKYRLDTDHSLAEQEELDEGQQENPYDEDGQTKREWVYEQMVEYGLL